MVERALPRDSAPKLIKESLEVFLHRFPDLHPPYGLVAQTGETAVNELTSYATLAELCAFSLIFSLKQAKEDMGIKEADLTPDQLADLKIQIRKIAEAPVNGMYTIARILELVPKVILRARPMQSLRIEELMTVAINSTQLTLLLAGNNSYRSRLVWHQLALAPHISFSKDGRLIQEEELDPHAFILKGEGDTEKIEIAMSQEEIEFGVQALDA